MLRRNKTPISATELQLFSAAGASVASAVLELVALLGFLPPNAGRYVTYGATGVGLLFLLLLRTRWRDPWSTLRLKRSVKWALNVCYVHWIAGVVGLILLDSPYGFGLASDDTAWPARLLLPARYIAACGFSLATSLAYSASLAAREGVEGAIGRIVRAAEL